MFEAVRMLNSNGNKKPLLVDTGEGVTTNAQNQVEIISRHFREIFHNQNVPNMPTIEPIKITKPSLLMK
jgi:hypothetical protein